MKIHSVRLSGFGAFKHETHVDFDEFAADGVFLISGPTGAGKSTLLDAIVFALYGSAPRYASQPGAHVRSHYSEPHDATWAEVEFTAGGTRYRVRRSPDYLRPKRRGEGFTTEKATAQLDALEDSHWVGLEAHPRTVAERLAQIIPLNAGQFLQVVLLAQGRFEQFLLASSAERQRLLRTLFDTGRFDSYDQALQARAAQARDKVSLAERAAAAEAENLAELVGTEVPADPNDEWVTTLLAEQLRLHEVAARHLTFAQQREETTRAAHEAARDMAHRQQRRRHLESEAALLVAAGPAVEGARAALEAGGRAQLVVPHHQRLRDAVAHLDEAQESLTKAEAAFAESFGAPAELDAPQLRDDLVAQRSVVARGLEAEQAHDLCVARLSELTRVKDEVGLAAHQLESELITQRAVLDLPVRVSLGDAQAALEALGRDHDRARRHTRARAHAARCEAQALECGEEVALAQSKVNALRRALMEGYAGTLATHLVDGAPCPVCGSCAHPAPSSALASDVSSADIEEAEAHSRQCRRAEAEAQQAAAQARVLVAETAGERSEEEASVALEVATQTLASARAEAARREEAEGAVARFTAALHDHALEAARINEQLEGARAEEKRLQAEVDLARAGAETVAERSADLEEQLRVVTTVVRLRTEVTTAFASHSAARLAYDEALEARGFTDTEEFRAAVVDPSELARLRQHVQAHDSAVSANHAALADPDLHDVPAEPLDLAASESQWRRWVETSRDASVETAAAHERLRGAERAARRLRAGWHETAADRMAATLVQRLANSVHGESPNTRRLRLESYVLAIELGEIVRAANTRLRTMTAHRYELQVSQQVATRGNNAGLDVQVRDEHTGTLRAPESLSGGERFLASLSLALGLAEVVTQRAGGITLDTLFVDEGFGALDAESMEQAMLVLDGLREHGRTVGLISHVPALLERITAQVVVTPSPGGWSQVQVIT